MGRSTSDNSHWLIADIGATNARCAIHTPGNEKPAEFRTFLNEDFDSLESLLSEYASGLDARPPQAMLAVAAAIYSDSDSDSVQMVNRDWQFSTASLAKALRLSDVQLINDYHAVAYALPRFRNDQLCEIGKAKQQLEGNYAVLGPGSGLGMAAWIGNRQSGSAMTGEGGHITLSARNAAEQKIIRKIQDRYGHCSAERILSGPGIVDLHHAMHGARMGTPEEITTNLDNPACTATMNQFFSFLGSVAAELALITGSFGGLYIAGGIVPACLEQMNASPFRGRFEDKNRYKNYMQAIPTYVIIDEMPGLTGLGACIRSASEQA